MIPKLIYNNDRPKQTSLFMHIDIFFISMANKFSQKKLFCDSLVLRLNKSSLLWLL